jgi:hypothetical protein
MPPPVPHRDWIDLSQAFGPIIAVAVALVVGFTHWSLQKRQLDQDLFEKRWKVYSGLQNYLVALLREDEADDLYAPYRPFRLDTDPGEFLFGEAMWKYIKKVGDTGVRFRTVRSLVKQHSIIVHAPGRPINGDNQQWLNAVSKLDEAQQEEDELRRSITQAFEGGAKDRFAKYLRIGGPEPGHVFLKTTWASLKATPTRLKTNLAVWIKCIWRSGRRLFEKAHWVRPRI